MSQATYLDDLIERMHDDTPFTHSDDSVSFQAHREAEKLEDSALLDVAILRVPAEKSKKVRDALYFIIAKLALNTDCSEAVNFLIKRLNAETDKYALMSMLDRLAELPKDKEDDLSPIIEHTKDKRWQVRYSAIQALDRSKSETAEAVLVEILNSSEDPYDLTYCNSTLNRIGTRKAIPAIEQHLKSRKRDVKDSAKMAIEEIIKRDEG